MPDADVPGRKAQTGPRTRRQSAPVPMNAGVGSSVVAGECTAPNDENTAPEKGRPKGQLVVEKVDPVGPRRIRCGAVIRRAAAAIAVAVLWVSTVAGGPARAADSTYVPYYTVTTSYQGAPETLASIAQRYLGGAERAIEIYHLNAGRKQAGGGTLTDADKLAAGWRLVLPWDAAGAGVQYGVLATGEASPANPGPAASSPAPKPSPSRPGPEQSRAPQSPAPAQDSKPAVQPTPRKKTGTPAAGGSACPTLTRAGKEPDWARTTLGADRAWDRTRGQGQLVAVVDSGVDGSLPQLDGHVTEGADVVSGSGRADVDCLGTGTAMAAIVVAERGKGGPAGIAPDATVLPLRITGAGKPPSSLPADQATAITVAAAAGATVIVLGSYADSGDPAVVQAVADAVAHDIVVVLPAPVTGASAAAANLPARGVLRVGGTGTDGRPMASYVSGAVDVTAPGVKVRSLGPTGTGQVLVTGDQYAAAFVAGQVALVRSAHAGLPAGAVTDLVERSAGPAARSGTGAGMIDTAAAVAAAPSAAAGSSVPPPAAGPGRPRLRRHRPRGAGAAHLPREPARDERRRGADLRARLGGGVVGFFGLKILVGLVLVVALVLLVVRLRRLVRADDGATAPRDGGEPGSGPPWPVPSGPRGAGGA